MNVIQLGSRGNHVRHLQKILIEAGYLDGSPDGVFGAATQRAVKAAQEVAGEVVDGIVGQRTWDALERAERDDWRLSEGAYEWAADTLQCELAAIKAVGYVESAGSGFIDPNHPTILFERHWMYRRLTSHGLNLARDLAADARPDLVNSSVGGYEGGFSEWRRFREAYSINHDAAIESTSWGRFQIMGFHWEVLGYPSAEDFKTLMSRNEDEQLKAFVRFIMEDARLHRAIQERDWTTFARIYNGPGYEKNRYDAKMAKAYSMAVKK